MPGNECFLVGNDSALFGKSTIKGNLSCFGNDRVELGVGGPLTVGGNRSGQC